MSHFFFAATQSVSFLDQQIFQSFLYFKHKILKLSKIYPYLLCTYGYTFKIGTADHIFIQSTPDYLHIQNIENWFSQTWTEASDAISKFNITSPIVFTIHLQETGSVEN